MIFCHLLKKFFQEQYQSVKWIRQTFCRAQSGYKLFARIISRWQNLSLACKDTWQFLAHLSRRLRGELLVYQWLRRLSSVVRPSVNIFKHLLLWNHWANWTQISCGDSLGWGNECLFKCSWSRDQDGRHAHIWIKPLSSTGSILSNTDLSDLSTVGTCDIFVYQMRHRVMWFARLADSILFIKRVITCH